MLERSQFPSGMSHTGLGREAGLSLCPLPTHHFWPFPLTWSAGPGKAKQKEADPSYDLLQRSKWPWYFSAIKINRRKLRISYVTNWAPTWKGFRKKNRTKKWENASGRNTEKLGLRFRHHTRNKQPPSNSQQMSNSLGSNCLRNRLGTKAVFCKWLLSGNTH